MQSLSLPAYGLNLMSKILSATNMSQITDYATSVWTLTNAELIPHREYEYLAQAIERQKIIVRPSDTIAGRAPDVAARAYAANMQSHFPPHRRAGIPPEKRAASWLRRKQLAKDCPIPTHLARLFTVGELAVLNVIAIAFVERGQSTMSLPEIAARAGVGCTTGRMALRRAASLGLILIVENRRRGKRNLPNTIRVISQRWRQWLEEYRRRKTRAAMEAKVMTAGNAGRPVRLFPGSEKASVTDAFSAVDPLKKLRPSHETYIKGKRDKPARLFTIG